MQKVPAVKSASFRRRQEWFVIARENLTRVLNDWQRHKILTRLSGYHCLEDKRQLEHQAKF
jgi:hypothetical protein